MKFGLKNILVCVQVVILFGCSNIGLTKHDNPMPDLYHPQTELAKKKLKVISAQQETDDAKKGPIVKLNNRFVKGGSDIVVTVTDTSCPTGQSPTLSITHGGSAVGASSVQGNMTSLAVDSNSLTGNDVTLEYSSCSQTGKLRKSYQIYKTPLKIEGPKENFFLKDQIYPLSIYDDCAGGGFPQVLFDPPDAGNLVNQTGNYWNFAVDTRKASIIEGSKVQVTVHSCRGLSLAPEKAKEAGLFKNVSYQVVKSSFQGVSTKLVVWPYENVINEFGKAFADTFYAADVVFVNRNPKSLLVYGSSLTAKIRFTASRESVEKVYTKPMADDPSLFFIPDENGKILADRINWKESWRPLSFSDVLAIFSYQQESNPRRRGMELLKSLGVLLTGASVFTPGIDYTRGVAFFTGIFNPELEKQLLWDMLLHLKNVEARALKEVEEIPPNGQLRKAVFFPKDAIYGIIPEMPVYISEIRPDPAGVNVTLIEKEATVESSPDQE